eukprot:340681-Chlamydomonas_euryale.AAC.2
MVACTRPCQVSGPTQWTDAWINERGRKGEGGSCRDEAKGKGGSCRDEAKGKGGSCRDETTSGKEGAAGMKQPAETLAERKGKRLPPMVWKLTACTHLTTCHVLW